MDFSDWLVVEPTRKIFGKELAYIPVDSPELNGQEWDLMADITSILKTRFGVKKNQRIESLDESVQAAIGKDPELTELQNKLIQLHFPETQSLDLNNPRLRKQRALMLVEIHKEMTLLSDVLNALMERAK